ncbi:response regulator [Histidinibacterium lentulum]|uniref:Response regulator n=1 Tax=Histidinibacterium lentulum TaxID=2480588 RepID=A0A3N2QY03_9RHOB|nr:response regulator [Histidinibacterium lentulum]
MALNDAGCFVEGPIGSLPEALRVAAAEDFDAAVVDINLGDEFAWPAARVLKARGIPFIFATGYAASLEAPADLSDAPRVEKPFDPKRLLSALSSA